MKVLDAGTEQLSNADVLNWIKQKRQQHHAEDTAARETKQRLPQRPSNFMTTLEKHERFLDGPQFPYTSNPSVYLHESSNGAHGDGYDSMREFDRLVCERIILPVQAAHDAEVAAGDLTPEQAAKKTEHDQDMKSLSEAELLMIYNHAPRAVEMLQPMIDSIEERFTEQEQEVMLEIISQVYRKDELANTNAGGP